MFISVCAWVFLYDIFICCLAYRMNDSSLWPINLRNYLHSLHQLQPSVCMEPSYIMSKQHVPMNETSNMTDHPFISTSHHSDTLKIMLCMWAFINWCDFSSAERNCVPAHICLMLYAVKYIEDIIRVEEELLFFFWKCVFSRFSAKYINRKRKHLTYKTNKYWLLSSNEMLNMTEPVKVVSCCPPLYTCPNGHIVSRQSQVSLWSWSFVVPWAKLYVFSLKGQEHQTANQ